MPSDRQGFRQSWHTAGRTRPHVLIADQRGNWVSDEAVPGAGFGQLLRRCRKICGLTQEELSERAGVSVRTIADLERGRRTRPYRQTIAALAGALGLRGRELDGFVRVARPSLRPISDDGPADPTPGAQGMPVPRQLPAAVAGFTGRSGELAALTSLLGPEAETQRPALVISAIGGTAGVGKTALAVHWAHRVKDLFPGGQLYVNLRGYDPYEPVGPGIALAGFLQALGVPGQQIPDETEDRARLYRSRLAGLRMLVVLDNARDAEQVRPLLPGDPGCVAVITSRDQAGRTGCGRWGPAAGPGRAAARGRRRTTAVPDRGTGRRGSRGGNQARGAVRTAAAGTADRRRADRIPPGRSASRTSGRTGAQPAGPPGCRGQPSRCPCGVLLVGPPTP